MLGKTALILSALACAATVAYPATFINVGHHLLLPNTPNQKVEIYVTGGDQVNGAEVYAQIGDGDPTSEFDTPIFQFDGESEPPFTYPGPNLSTFLAPGSIFATPENLGESDASSHAFPRLWMAGTLLPYNVAAEGLLVTLYIDTTGYESGTWSLKLFDTIVAPTSWGIADAPPPIITEGSITIGVPEPSTVALAAVGMITFAGIALGRRRTH